MKRQVQVMNHEDKDQLELQFTGTPLPDTNEVSR